MANWILVILLFTGDHRGGRAIDTQAHFASEQACQAAADRIAADHARARGAVPPSFSLLSLSCVASGAERPLN